MFDTWQELVIGGIVLFQNIKRKGIYKWKDTMNIMG